MWVWVWLHETLEREIRGNIHTEVGFIGREAKSALQNYFLKKVSKHKLQNPLKPAVFSLNNLVSPLKEKEMKKTQKQATEQCICYWNTVHNMPYFCWQTGKQISAVVNMQPEKQSVHLSRWLLKEKNKIASLMYEWKSAFCNGLCPSRQSKELFAIPSCCTTSPVQWGLQRDPEMLNCSAAWFSFDLPRLPGFFF